MTRFQAIVAIKDNQHVTHPYVSPPAGSYIFFDGLNFRWWNGHSLQVDCICDMIPQDGYTVLERNS